MLASHARDQERRPRLDAKYPPISYTRHYLSTAPLKHLYAPKWTVLQRTSYCPPSSLTDLSHARGLLEIRMTKHRKENGLRIQNQPLGCEIIKTVPTDNSERQSGKNISNRGKDDTGHRLCFMETSKKQSFHCYGESDVCGSAERYKCRLLEHPARSIGSPKQPKEGYRLLANNKASLITPSIARHALQSEGP